MPPPDKGVFMKKIKNLFLLILLFILPIDLFSAVTSVAISRVGVDGAYLEAGTTNNLVYHMKISTDGTDDSLQAISITNALDSWSQGPATEPASIQAGSVKLWYSSDDNFSDAHVIPGAFAVSGGNVWNDNPAISVTNNSGIFVTVDISSSTAGGTIEMQSNGLAWFSGVSTPAVNPIGAPANPAVLQIVQAPPATSLLVSHTNGTMQPYSSTGQENLIPMELSFYNNSAVGAAPIIVTSITLTVQSNSPYGTVLDPADIISNIRIQDATNGTVYGSSSGAAIPDAQTAVIIPISSLNVPFQTSVTTTVYISITPSAVSAGDNFVLSLISGNAVTAVDNYTLAPVTVSASPSDSTGFTMNSNYTTIEPAAVSISAGAVSVIAPNINKGQKNVQLFNVYFSSPVPASYASAEVNNLKVALADINMNPLIPANLLSKIYVTSLDGSIIYGSKDSTTLETTGGFASIPLINTVVVPAGSSVTVVVRADISPTTVSNNFKAGIASTSDILARDKNSFSSVSVYPAMPFPFYSAAALLSSSFTVTHTADMPKNLYKGDANVKSLEINLNTSLSFGSGNLLVRGVTLTASDGNNASEDFSSAVSQFRITAAGQDITVSAPSSDKCYFVFPQPVTVPAAQPATVPSVVTVYIFPRSDATARSLQVSLASASDINVYQDNDPLRVISITPGAGDSFPMSSGIGYITGDTAALTLTNYPNPFKAGSTTRFAYYLADPSGVTIKIYDITGRIIRTVCDNISKSPGSHEEDFWDGTDAAGRYCLAGTYVARGEFKSTSGQKQTLTRKITFVK